PPAAFGEKTTLKVACFPAAMVSGIDVPEIVTPAAVVLTCLTVRFDPPLFVIVTDLEAVPPTRTEPKLTEAGATEIAAAGALCWPDGLLDALVNPMQPEL